MNTKAGAHARQNGLLYFVPAGTDLTTLALLAFGLAVMYLPSFIDLANGIWATDEQGHGPIILAVSLWLFFQRRQAIAAVDPAPQRLLGYSLGLFGLTLYAIGRSQGILMFEIGSLIVVIAALLLVLKGFKAVRIAIFPILFLLFMVPLPGAFVAAVTTPLKSMVSFVASNILHLLQYPVGRSGVILTVGPYQLLVADACAGLNSMFTLEALGMLYMNLMGYTSVARNATLAILIIPISFFANVIRVMILVLVTYHFGDEAGQGFIHGFAGMVLFMVALVLMLITDKLLNIFFNSNKGKELPTGARP